MAESEQRQSGEKGFADHLAERSMDMWLTEKAAERATCDFEGHDWHEQRRLTCSRCAEQVYIKPPPDPALVTALLEAVERVEAASHFDHLCPLHDLPDIRAIADLWAAARRLREARGETP